MWIPSDLLMASRSPPMVPSDLPWLSCGFSVELFVEFLVCSLRGMLPETELREQPRAMEHTLATHAGYDSGM